MTNLAGAGFIGTWYGVLWDYILSQNKKEDWLVSIARPLCQTLNEWMNEWLSLLPNKFRKSRMWSSEIFGDVSRSKFDLHRPFRSWARDVVIARLTMHWGTVLGGANHEARPPEQSVVRLAKMLAHTNATHCRELSK